MDTTFIKMCDCEEIQGREWEYGDCFIQIYANGQSSELQFMSRELDDPYYGDYPIFEGGLRAIWLPTQEQLQDMVIDEKDSEGKYIVLLHDFLEWVLDDCTDLGWSHSPSMEELWVAFVMHTLHQKYWTENGWETVLNIIE